MDIFAHPLWTFIVFYRYKLVHYSILFSLLPDFFSWGIYTIFRFVNDIPFGRPILSLIPDWVFTLYGITHSLIIVAIVFTIIYLIYKKIPLFMYAWPMHILIDIPSHLKVFLGTPFLWPISNYVFDGISWGTPSFMAINYISLMVFLSITLVYRINILLFIKSKLFR